MRVELICVGSELLSGDIVNTNAAYISKRLRELGHESQRQFTVSDNRKLIANQVSDCLKNCDILILTGGLGPTDDDMTKEAVCDALGLTLEENAHCRKHITTFFERLGRTPTSNNYKQATAPRDAVIFENENGTACGIGIEHKDKTVIMLPGPPKELVLMFDKYVAPYLQALSTQAIATHSLNVFGMGESAVENAIHSLCGQDNPVVATYCDNNECRVKITSTAETPEEAEAICAKTVLKIKQILGDVVYAADSDGLASEVVKALREHKLKISTAESCTGGMLSQALTSVSHSSEVVEIGILAYSNRIKHEALSVPQTVLDEHGAISWQTAMYLAKNVRLLSDSDIGVGITGNAGPTASEGKDIGLVYVAIADKTKYFVKRLNLSPTYDREKIRSYATLTALDLVRQYVAAKPFTMAGMVDHGAPFVFAEDMARRAPTEENIVDAGVDFLVYQNNDKKKSAENISEPVLMAESEPIAPFVDNMEPEAMKPEASKTERKAKAKKISFNPLPALRNIGRRLTGTIKNILPAKNDKVLDIVIKITSIVAALGLLISSGVLISMLLGENNQRQIIETAREDFNMEQDEKNEDDVYKAFDELLAQNGDVKGWLSISNTNVNNPVYQTTDNDYYLNHNMLKEKSKYGALFFDYRDTVSADTVSQNLTIYGHNMRDKSMFGSLTNYRQLAFYKQNPTIRLKTLYDEAEYAIFAIMITNASAKDDNGYIYNYTLPHFETSEAFMEWIEEAKKKSLIKTNISVSEDDQILTLSTCCYDFNNARFVIMAKRLAEGESAEAGSATLNPNVKYPQAWYDKRGLKGYKDSDSSSAPSTDDSSEDMTDNSSEESSSVPSDEPSSSQASSGGGSSETPSSPTDSTSTPTSTSTSTSTTPEGSEPQGSENESSDMQSGSSDSGSPEDDGTNDGGDTDNSGTSTDDTSTTT